MGHQHCGAIIGAIDGVKLGNLTTTLSNIKPAIKMSQDYNGEMTSGNEEFVRLVSVNNNKGIQLQLSGQKAPF
ncbi:MAG: hypothetical protein R2758_07130 [Bacteroidales bacterium]